MIKELSQTHIFLLFMLGDQIFLVNEEGYYSTPHFIYDGENDLTTRDEAIEYLKRHGQIQSDAKKAVNLIPVAVVNHGTDKTFIFYRVDQKPDLGLKWTELNKDSLDPNKLDPVYREALCAYLKTGDHQYHSHSDGKSYKVGDEIEIDLKG